MRLLQLINDDEVVLTEYFYERIPHYAVLSHTWGPDSEEVSFRDMETGMGKLKKGYRKLLFIAREARRDGLIYSWVDTCCIDKTNNNELSEAITSMYRWYREAAECYVYLADVPDLETSFLDRGTWDTRFERSRWFKRGFTLQELIAPSRSKFYSQDYMYQGNKEDLEEQIHRATNIPMAVIRGADLSQYTATEKMGWTKGRKTRRVEDGAYCLLGIFGIFMPLIYGEGKNAFLRLQEQINLLPKTEKRVEARIDTKPEMDKVQEETTNNDKSETADAETKTDQPDNTSEKAPESDKPAPARIWRYKTDIMMSFSDIDKVTAAEVVIENCQIACWHVYQSFSLWRCKFDRQDPNTAPKLFEIVEGGLPTNYTDLSLQGWLHKIMHAYDAGDIPSGALQAWDAKAFLSQAGRIINLNIIRIRHALKDFPDNPKFMVECFERHADNAVIFCQHFGDIEAHSRIQKLQHMLRGDRPLMNLDELLPPDSPRMKILFSMDGPPSTVASIVLPVRSATTEEAEAPTELPTGSSEDSTDDTKGDH